MKTSLALQIEMKKNELARAKPHSRRRHELFFKLRELMTQQIRKEIRDGRLTA